MYKKFFEKIGLKSDDILLIASDIIIFAFEF